jgi:hypothetical protein
VDESETGSANLWSKTYDCLWMHLRPPSIDRGVTSFLWAFGLGLFIWLGLVAVGVHRGTALVLALLSFGAIFLFVRTRGARA